MQKKIDVICADNWMGVLPEQSKTATRCELHLRPLFWRCEIESVRGHLKEVLIEPLARWSSRSGRFTSYLAGVRTA